MASFSGSMERTYVFIRAQFGGLPVLQWLRSQEPPCLTCAYAALNGHLSLLQWPAFSKSTLSNWWTDLWFCSNEWPHWIVELAFNSFASRCIVFSLLWYDTILLNAFSWIVGLESVCALGGQNLKLYNECLLQLNSVIMVYCPWTIYLSCQSSYLMVWCGKCVLCSQRCYIAHSGVQTHSTTFSIPGITEATTGVEDIRRDTHGFCNGWKAYWLR